MIICDNWREHMRAGMAAFDPDKNRHWNSEGQCWVWPEELENALDAANLAISEYYNGNRQWAEAWLLRAYEANQKDAGK